MSVIATFSTASDSFPLGKTIENQPSAEIEIERIVPMRQRTFPFIFVWDHTDFEQFEETMEEITEIELAKRLETFENGRLYKITWTEDKSPLISEIVNNSGTILLAEGNTDSWRFEIRFPEHANVSVFFQEVTSNSAVDLELESLVQEVSFYSTTETSVVTPKQEEALKTALKLGYYDVPRGAHLDDVAEALAISPSATSALLRRGCSRYFEHEFWMN